MIIDGYTTPGTTRETRLDAGELLGRMDRAGVDQAVIAPEDGEIAVENDDGNRRILAMAAGAGGRLIPACSVNPWRRDGQRLLREASEAGAKLLVLSGALQGFIPTDELADPLLALAGELGLPVYLHTGPHGAGGPAQAVLVAERHPGTRFILGHCGSTDHAWDMAAILRHHRLENVWYELSYVRPWGVSGYIEEAGADRFIWASGEPRNPMQFELEQVTRSIPVGRYPQVFGGNLRRILAGGAA